MTKTTDPRPRCIKCHRVLRSIKSIERGYGPTCAGRVRANAVAVAMDFKPVQVEKAVEAIELKAVIPARGNVFHAVPANGVGRYYVNADTHACTCKAGQRGVRCYHVAAVRILTAA